MVLLESLLYNKPNYLYNILSSKFALFPILVIHFSVLFANPFDCGLTKRSVWPLSFLISKHL